jgi:hypothetical protein
MSHSAWFRELAEAMVDLNLCVIGADRRGSGLNEQDRGNVPSRSALLRDLGDHRAAKYSQCSRVPCRLVLGSSIGGSRGTRVFGTFPRPHPYRTWIVPFTINYPCYAGAGKGHNANTFLDQPCLRTPIKEDMFTNGPPLHDFILKDQLRLLTFTPRFWRIMIAMRASAERHLPQLSQPVLLILARRDLTVRNEETLHAFTTW